MRRTYLEFEGPLRELDRALDGARAAGDAAESGRLQVEIERESRRIHATLTPWQRVQLSRHLDRPFALDYVQRLFTEVIELHGDRRFGDDPAIVGGTARRAGRPLVFVGHQRGRTTAEKVKRNFGMPRPEGYRKALRLFRLAGTFGLPIVTLVDTQGAYPGPESEERGIAESIAGCLHELAIVPVPVVAVLVGEGGSGGALALAVADELLMLENSCLAVITPEGCSSILSRGRTTESITQAAASLRLTAPDLARLGIADRVVAEPLGGAHRDRDATIDAVGGEVDAALARLGAMPTAELLERRRERLRAFGRSAVVDG